MAKEPNIHDEADLNRFVSREWGKALAFLQNRYGIAEDDCKDIFQESFLVLHKNIREGKLEEMTASLSTYFLSICKNKALEFLRGASRSVGVEREADLSLMDGEIQNQKIEALLALDEGDEVIEAQKEELVRSIVRDLPSPCNELLWGFYRDNLSMKSLADMFNYKSEGVVKVTKHRCSEKFRERYNRLCNKLF